MSASGILVISKLVNYLLTLTRDVTSSSSLSKSATILSCNAIAAVANAVFEATGMRLDHVDRGCLASCGTALHSPQRIRLLEIPIYFLDLVSKTSSRSSQTNS